VTITAKICGVNSTDAVRAVVAGGASHIGFVFYPPSPRSVSPEQAAALMAGLPDSIVPVGLFVDADDDWIDAVCAAAPLGMLQLHGKETPERAAALKARHNRLVMKAISVAKSDDVDRANNYVDAVDWLLFDAKPPPTLKNALPGGNAVQFDWSLMAGRAWPLPWMLAGGIDAANVGRAVRDANAPVVDVSSGVEDAPGVKNPQKIAEFLSTVAALPS
jgi:phosphoribosylanthranilate isomerase